MPVPPGRLCRLRAVRPGPALRPVLLAGFRLSHRQVSFSQPGPVRQAAGRGLQFRRPRPRPGLLPETRSGRLHPGTSPRGVPARVLAPVDGMVKLPERLAPGDFVAPGQPVAHIVPAGERLVARVRIPAADVSRVSPGLHAEIRVGALDFTRFGKVPGEVASVSPGALISEQGQVYYAAEIALQRQSLSDGQTEQPLLPGMQVDAEIVNGSRTILEYLFKPMKLALEDAFREK
nr:HlyD family efflux transporter periplasmic adaptor subunit [Mangrovicoccus ximenensis]